MAFQPKRFFDGARYVGRARGPRVTYHVFEAGRRYLLVWPSTRSSNSYYMSEIPRTTVEALHRRFGGRTATSVEAKRKMGGPGLRHLNALYALTALKRARVKNATSRPLQFHVYK